MTQYPDTIVITVTTPATQNTSTGLWTAGTSTTYTLECRAETNSKAAKVAGNDGVMIDFAFNCYLPVMTTVIPFGSAFTLTLANNGTVTGKIKGAKNGQLNSRLWL
jgi:hypothetical protein